MAREKHKRVSEKKQLMRISHSRCHLWARALVQAVRICPSKIHPRFRPFESFVKLTAKCNRIGWAYFAATH
jgi:hypothetical protein